LNVEALLERLLNLIYPPRCVACQQRGVLFCPACAGRCAATYADGAPPEGGPWGLYAFRPPLQEAIHALKYKGLKGLAQPLGRLLAGEAQRLALLGPDVALAWVPLHPARQQERGFNQAELLARQAAAALGRPLAGGLRRLRATTPQVGLSGAERRANLQDAFQWAAAEPPPQRIALIDDVLTTGSTFAACAEALRAAGAQQVSCVALALARQ
jgi:ComF family protein